MVPVHHARLFVYVPGFQDASSDWCPAPQQLPSQSGAVRHCMHALHVKNGY